MITILDDQSFEIEESFIVEVSVSVNSAIIATLLPNVTLVTIVDNDRKLEVVCYHALLLYIFYMYL